MSAGGAIGAVARHGLSTVLPGGPFAVGTFTVNLVGGFLIGVLMVVLTEIRPGTRLIRPFLGVGVLGGFTTFSSYILDIGRALNAGAVLAAIAYTFASLAAALLAAALGMFLTRRFHARREAE